MTTLDKILDFTGGEKFYRFGNSDGKYWIMPARSMRTAMNLYQPSGSKGKLVKSLLPCLHFLAPVRKVIHAEKLHCRLNGDLRELLCKVFGTRDIEFSIFEGTPCIHQKITIQLSTGKHILGYCKASESNDIKELFDKEHEILAWMKERGVTDIPQALYCGTLGNGVHLFVQSTAKTTSSTIIHKWDSLHEEFLAQLHDRTKQKMLFEESDYYNTLLALEEHIEWLPDNIEAKIISTTIGKIRDCFCGKEVELSAYHGDFTPWNMFANKKRLFVFDFEYAAKSYPPGLDRYHFFTQTAIFERHWNANDITAFIESDNGKWIDKKLYKIYLLDMISRFTLRENGKVSGKAAAPFALWGKILESLMVNN
ncbi:MAG: phosphotransferase [Bacteroidales bacterium]|nr:phosphotransferase [Bacteroidales bacterium]